MGNHEINGADAAASILELLRADGVLYLLALPFRAPFPPHRYPIRNGWCEWCGDAARAGRLWCAVCWAHKTGEGHGSRVAPITEAEPAPGRHYTPVYSEAAAIAAGLTIKTRRKRAPKALTLRGECACCQELRAIGEPFCLRCWSELLRFEACGVTWQEAFDAAASLYAPPPAKAAQAAA